MVETGMGGTVSGINHGGEKVRDERLKIEAGAGAADHYLNWMAK
jgi:hypothetical protein